MAKKKPAPSGASATQAPCLQYQDILGMTQDDRLARFQSNTHAQSRLFIECGKLFRAMEENLQSGESIFGVLQAAGIKKGSASNASYAAKVYDLVRDEKLSEAEFDTFTFQDCVAIQRARSKTSKRQLTPDEIVAVIRNSPDGDFAEDLNCFYEAGCTREEKAEAEARAAAEKERAKADAEERQRKQAEELEAEKARNEQLKREIEAEKAKTPAPAPAAEAPAPAAPAKAAKGKDKSAPATTPAPAATAPEPPSAQAGEVEAESALPTAEELIRLLTDIELSVAQLPAEEQALVAAKILEMAARFEEVAA